METLMMTGFIAMVVGVIAGSYFAAASVNDNKILKSKVFRLMFLLYAGASIIALLSNKYLSYTLREIFFPTQYLVYLTVAFFAYSLSYFLSHALVQRNLR